MKKLMEGLGSNLNVKYINSFTGFVGSYLLMTCNSLCYPWVEPPISNMVYSRDEYLLDNEAMYDRASVVEFTKKFTETRYAFDGNQWAQCLLFMTENFD